MKDRTTVHRPTGMFGAASLLVIFAVLCMTVLALLTLGRVKTGTEASVRAAEQTAALCNAEVRAHEILAGIRAGAVPDGVVRSGTNYTYTCPIAPGRTLEVTAEVDDSGGYRILAWRQISVPERQPDETIAVWDGTIPNGDES